MRGPGMRGDRHDHGLGRHRLGAAAVGALTTVMLAAAAGAVVPTPVPPAQRGSIDAERSGFHDAANLRTVFWNFGMVGDYPLDPLRVDLTTFHSAEAPKGSGMNYSDGITPFVLAKVQTTDGQTRYIMETGYRERQELSPFTSKIMRFEPRPGYFEPTPGINVARSPAISSDTRTWPGSWPDRLDDPDDPGWAGSWNGYFGKRPAADQESFTVMDDQFYDAWQYFPDSRDATRKGLGLRIEVRGFQWANPQAGNVIFWHYDITNESTTDYDDNIIFGLYNDSGVGGSAISCEGIAESDDDNAFWDRAAGLNLVYTWDKGMKGVDLAGNCSRTGYLGYAYLETPGNPFDLIDNDLDGITDELRDGGRGTLIEGQAAIRAYLQANYDLARYEAFYGPLENRPAYRAGTWWTGDEDLDWESEFSDVGADGVAETGDTGEGDGMPSTGEPNFDRTDLNESDQIGLTGFKMNRIRAGAGNPDPTTDGIVFYTDTNNWPQRLWDKFTDPNPAARFDSALAANYNIGFLFASGPFKLKAGRTERFSLALAYGSDLSELRTNVRIVQQIYDANYQFAVPPPLPTVTAETGDGFVRLSWDNVAERGIDPVTFDRDFEGYRIYRSTDPEFRDVRVLTTGRGNASTLNGKPIAQFDLVDSLRGYYPKVTVDGVSYWLGDETGITHTWTDTEVVNGQRYYYAVCAYDWGSRADVPDDKAYFPSENAISVTGKPRGGFVLPPNVVEVRPNPRVAGFERAAADTLAHVAGRGSGVARVEVVSSAQVPDGRRFRITFTTPAPESLRATEYAMTDLSLPDSAAVLFRHGRDLDGAGVGPVAYGLLPVIDTPVTVAVDTSASGYRPGSPTNTRLSATYLPSRSINYRRIGFPDDLSIEFSDAFLDTSLALGAGYQVRRAKFRIMAHTPGGDVQLNFRFRDFDFDGTLSAANESFDILCTPADSVPSAFDATWRIALDTLGQAARGPIVRPGLGDFYDLALTRAFSVEDTLEFSTRAQRINTVAAQSGWGERPYVVPNPYIGSASFEAQRFAESGRGERRIEFRAIPLGSVIRIYTVRGTLVETLRQDGTEQGFVAWNLRTRDNLDVAPGLYLFHVEAPGLESHVGKFAVIK
jgi:hypothetical protein